MNEQDCQEFIRQAFEALVKRGWCQEQELEPSPITLEDIAAFEKQHQITLPPLYKAFLTSYCLPNRGTELMAIANDMDEIAPLWLLLHSPRSMEEVSEQMKILQIIKEFCELPEGCFHNLVPIGDWGAGWGPLCLDLSRLEEADKEKENTWSLVWFDHEEFDWDRIYLYQDGLLHGMPAAPNLKTLLEWYFFGSLEAEFEADTGIKPTYEWYQSGAEY